jgi:hypothetical protein
VSRDDSADRARAEEVAREARIREGQGRIDAAFTQFDDPFYAGVTKAYNDYYTPQFDQQYTEALRKLQLGLAGSGGLESSAGIKKIANFNELANNQRTTIANSAVDAANKQKQAIEAERATLYDQNRAAADPSAAAANATTQAGLLSAPQTYSPLGDVFASFLNTAAAVRSGQNMAVGNQYLNLSPITPNTGGAGSSYIVR